MNVLGRRIVLTTLDPIPRALRATPGFLVMNQAEIDAFAKNDGEAFKMIVDIVQAEDAADARRTPARRRQHGHV